MDTNVDTTNTAVKDPVTVTLGCDPQVNVTLSETPTGTLFVVVASADPAVPVGDIDGIFFNLAQDSALDDLIFFPDANDGSIFSPVTGIQANANSVNTLANGAQVNDAYDVGIQFGTVDDSTSGSVPQANFTLSSANGPLTLDDLDLDSLTTVIQSDGGNGQVLTTGDTAGGDPVMVDTVKLFENFNNIYDPDESSAIVYDGNWEVRYGKLYTDGCNDGTLTLAEVEVAGAVGISFDAMVGDLHKFEATGSYADELRLEVQLNDGTWQTLDTFVVNADKSALVGSNTGNQITEQESSLSYEGGILDDVEGTAQFRFVSDITASDEQIYIDNIEVTCSEETSGGTETVAVQSEVIAEDFDGLHELTDSQDIVRADGWEAAYGGAYTDGCNDGQLTFASVETEGPATISFEAQVDQLCKFEASGYYADNLALQVRLDGGEWQTLDNFVVNQDKTALVGSETGKEITENASTLSYEGGILDDATSSVQFRFMSDISARDERILIDDVKIETTEMEVVDGGGDSGGADCDAQYDVQYIGGVPTVPMVEEDLIIPAEPEEELVDMDV